LLGGAREARADGLSMQDRVGFAALSPPYRSFAPPGRWKTRDFLWQRSRFVPISILSRLDLRRLPGDQPEGGGGSGSRGRCHGPHSGDHRALRPGCSRSSRSGAPQGECPDRKGHGDASQASFGVARTHAKVRLAPAPSAFPALRCLFGGRQQEAPPGAPKGRKNRPPGSAQRWLFDNLNLEFAT